MRNAVIILRSDSGTWFNNCPQYFMAKSYPIHIDSSEVAFLYFPLTTCEDIFLLVDMLF